MAEKKTFHDKEGHFTSKENDGGPCHHKGGKGSDNIEKRKDQIARKIAYGTPITEDDKKFMKESGMTSDEDFDMDFDEEFDDAHMSMEEVFTNSDIKQIERYAEHYGVDVSELKDKIHQNALDKIREGASVTNAKNDAMEEVLENVASGAFDEVKDEDDSLYFDNEKQLDTYNKLYDQLEFAGADELQTLRGQIEEAHNNGEIKDEHYQNLMDIVAEKDLDMSEVDDIMRSAKEQDEAMRARQASGSVTGKKELTLEDAIKNADDDVLDEQFGKDTPERKLAGAMKKPNNQQFEEKKKGNKYIDEDLENEIKSVFDDLKKKDEELGRKTSEYLDSGKFKSWADIRNDEVAMQLIKESTELSKQVGSLSSYLDNMKLARFGGSWTGPDEDMYNNAKEVMNNLKPEEFKEFSFYGQPVEMESDGKHGSYQTGIGKGRITKKYKARDLSDALEQLKKDYPDGFGIKYHEGPEGRKTHGQYENDYVTIEDLLRAQKKGNR